MYPESTIDIIPDWDQDQYHSESDYMLSTTTE